MLQPWNELVAAAVLGTARSQPVVVAPTDALSELVSGIATDDREQALLDASAVVALWRKAGTQPHHVPQSRPPAAPPDPSPICSPALHRALHAVLRLYMYRDVLPELLAQLLERRQRVPDELLPALLDSGAKQPELWPMIVEVGGTRGRWLAQHNPAWAGALIDDLAVWEHGTGDQRRVVLRHLRQRDPARARELLTATWHHEAHRDRAAFISVLQQGLNPADESFLEHALDDRRKEVRAAAADLLARLPTSGLVARMTARIDPLLDFVPPQRSRWLGLRSKGHPEIDVTLPRVFDTSMQRDGVEQKPARQEHGDKAWWLVQLLAAVPPAHWTARWQASPQEIMGAAAASEWGTVLLDGLAWATRRFGDVAWADALLSEECAELAGRGNDRRLTFDWLLACIVRHELMQVLPPQQREDATLRWCRSRKGERKAAFWTLLRACDHRWSLPFSRVVLSELRRVVAADTRSATLAIRGDLPVFEHRLAPELCAELHIGWPNEHANWHLWHGAITQMAAAVEFRASFQSA